MMRVAGAERMCRRSRAPFSHAFRACGHCRGVEPGETRAGSHGYGGRLQQSRNRRSARDRGRNCEEPRVEHPVQAGCPRSHARGAQGVGVGIHLAAVRGAKGRRCEGPVRRSDGPVRRFEGPVRRSQPSTTDLRTSDRTFAPRTGPSHRRPFAPSDRAFVSRPTDPADMSQ